MPKARFVCLANSNKEGGRCLAGIVLDEKNHPVFENDNSKWIRPICKTVHGEIPTPLVTGINILDIIEIEMLSFQNLDNHQPENVLFAERSLRVVGQYEKSGLGAFYASHRWIFGNRGKAIMKAEIDQHNHSLMFIKADDFEVYQDTKDFFKPMTRVKFAYHGNRYDLPVTDPVFLKNYQANPEFVKGYNQMEMTLSLGVEYKGWYYKLIACIILS